VAIAALSRALASPRLASHAARALEQLAAHGSWCTAGGVSSGPGVAAGIPEPSVPSFPDLDRTREWSPEAEENRTRQWAVNGDPDRTQAWSPKEGACVEAGEPRFGASGSERQRRGPGPGLWAARAMERRPRLLVPMGLQRFAGVAWALATCAVIGMGYMGWLVAQTPHRTQPRVLATVIVMTPGARVHSRKGAEQPVLKTARRGDYLRAVNKTANWWQVLFPNGRTGWIERRDTAVLVPDSMPGPAPVLLRPAVYAPTTGARGGDRS
jgi:hypothetical protein